MIETISQSIEADLELTDPVGADEFSIEQKEWGSSSHVYPFFRSNRPPLKDQFLIMVDPRNLGKIKRPKGRHALKAGMRPINVQGDKVPRNLKEAFIKGFTGK